MIACSMSLSAYSYSLRSFSAVALRIKALKQLSLLVVNPSSNISAYSITLVQSFIAFLYFFNLIYAKARFNQRAYYIYIFLSNL